MLDREELGESGVPPHEREPSDGDRGDAEHEHAIAYRVARRRRREQIGDQDFRIERAVGTKWAGHRINQVDFVRPRRSMSQIGG